MSKFDAVGRLVPADPPRLLWTGPRSIDLRAVLGSSLKPTEALWEAVDACGACCAQSGRQFGLTDLGDVFHMAHLGVVLRAIAEEPSFQEFRGHCEESWRCQAQLAPSGVKPPMPEMAEGSAAALLRLEGWKVVKVPRANKKRSSDLLASRGAQTIEIEVVHSSDKQTNVHRREAVERQLQQVRRRDDGSIHIHVLDEFGS